MENAAAKESNLITTWQNFEARLGIAQDPQAAPLDRLAAAQFLAGDGLFQEIAPLADALAILPETAAGAKRLAIICHQFERWGMHRRMEPYADPGVDPVRAARTRSALLLRREGRGDGLIVFVGDASQYWATIYMLERLLPKDRPILFLKDPDRIGFSLGTPALADRHDDMAPALERCMDMLGIRRFHVLGTSSGGFSALHFARTAGASAALALSPWTECAWLLDRVQTQDPENQRDEICGRGPAQPDLVALFAAPSPAPPIPMHLAYGADNAFDRQQAERMSGCPGVQLHPLDGCAQHDILGPLIASGAMQGLLERLFNAS